VFFFIEFLRCKLVTFFIRDLFEVYSRFICDLVTIFTIYLWTIRDLFAVYSRFIRSFRDLASLAFYSQIIRDLFAIYLQFIHDLFAIYLRFFRNLFLFICDWVTIFDLFSVYSRFSHSKRNLFAVFAIYSRFTRGFVFESRFTRVPLLLIAPK
jgi:hypothetical protein